MPEIGILACVLRRGNLGLQVVEIVHLWGAGGCL